MEEFSKASSLVMFDEACREVGLDPRGMLQRAGLPGDTLTHPDNMISFQRMAMLLDDCARESGHPLFGLELGLRQGTAVFGQLLYLVKNANTVGESLAELARYYHLHSSSGAVQMEVHNRLVILDYTPVLREGIPSRQVIEHGVAVGWQLLKMLLGRHWAPRALYLQTAAGAPARTYARLLNITPDFNSDRNAWVFDAALLEAPLSDADPALHALMQAHIDKLDELAPKELPAFVGQLLRSLLPNGKVSLNYVANYMMLGTRSLQRMLMEEGTSFQALLNETRQAEATRYLKESDISLTQLAGLLGYADLATFSKAFQRWFGMSPRQWREANSKSTGAKKPVRERRRPSWLR
ncbi:AraC family transcriptional regulator [Microbulbifer bruguierae]|uniref:AraC family transcriptional regulator n=1 Tax=Microbulbifer bruguierae TaxID=3029061 RepID=A0ABY8N8H5_9GAMM|nr:AraC family transcriptional regulator [Microbulbifer bruguierae]WGL15191.1 AraC family transcriptional regulator [Microbulbifer bruguierae]